MLETTQHPHSAFVTLTYSDENNPVTLVPKHLQDFLKRLRKKLEPSKIRFYAVGEYGDQTERPHYHLAIFNFPSCLHGWTRPRTHMLGKSCCASCDLIRDTWGLGAVFLGTLEDNSANYIAGYVTKKLTSKSDPRLSGRHPEFGRMSNRPGIGHDALYELASQILRFDLEKTQADVPSALRHGSRILPLGRYLQRKLRLMVGKDEKAPQAVIDEMVKEMLPLQYAARGSNTAPSLKAQIQEKTKGSLANLEARTKIFKNRKTL